jgi:hypothetical protein
MSNKPLFPDVLDERYLFSWKPESTLAYPFGYRFLIRDVKTGQLVVPSVDKDWWNELQQEVGETLTVDSALTTTINIKAMLEACGKKGGTFLLLAYIYDFGSETMFEREQSQYLIIIENGLKPPTLP